MPGFSFLKKEKIKSAFDYLRSVFKERFDLVIVFLSLVIFVFVLIFSLWAFYSLIFSSSIKKEEILAKKLEINSKTYQKITERMSKKKKIDDKYIQEKVNPLSDPFEKK